MNCVLVFLAVSLAVAFAIASEFKANEIISDNVTINRYKRQQSTRVWGGNRNQMLNNNNNGVTKRQKPTNRAHMQRTPCDPFKPKKPDFSQGRRKSGAKCLEYIWELKNRHDKMIRFYECLEYQKQQNPGNRPYYAIGGRNTVPGEFPHMGAIGWRAVVGTWIFKCGSSLISPKFLITAAHCSKVPSIDTSVANSRPEIVRLGDKNIIDVFANGQTPVDANISRFIVHPEYRPPKPYFDIAIIEISRKVSFDKYIQPACLWANPDTRRLGTKASLTGWGVVQSASQKTSPELQAAFVDIIDSRVCENLLRPAFNRHFNGIHKHQLCAGVLAGGVDSCQGDSGGPLQVKIPLSITTEGSMSYVIGVTSIGFGCARKNKPGVYTRVSSFINWIENIVWP